MFKDLFPKTHKKLKSHKKKIVPAISLGCIAGFIPFLPALLTGTESSTGIGVSLIISYALMLFLITALGIVSNQLNITKSLFNDYVNYPPYVHRLIIGIAVISIVSLIVTKLFIFIKNYKK